MDIKNLNGAQFHSIDAMRNRLASMPTDNGFSAPTNKAADDTSGLSNTARLVDVGRSEAMKLHESELAQIAESIQNGNYSADLNIVAERVAEVLYAAA